MQMKNILNLLLGAMPITNMHLITDVNSCLVDEVYGNSLM